MSDDPATRFRENATEITAMIVTGLWLAMLLGGVGFWLPFMLFGYMVVVPLVAILYGDEDDRETWWDDWWGDDSWDDWWGSSTDEDATAESTTADSGSTRAGDSNANPGDALETLRERYAAGELTDEQFERKLERLLETETLEDVQERARARRAGERRRDRDSAPRTRERDLEFDS